MHPLLLLLAAGHGRPDDQDFILNRVLRHHQRFAYGLVTVSVASALPKRSTSSLVSFGWSPSWTPTSIRLKPKCLGAKPQLHAFRLSGYRGVCQGCRDQRGGRSYSRASHLLLVRGKWRTFAQDIAASRCPRTYLFALPALPRVIGMMEWGPGVGLDTGTTRERCREQ